MRIKISISDRIDMVIGKITLDIGGAPFSPEIPGNVDDLNEELQRLICSVEHIVKNEIIDI